MAAINQVGNALTGSTGSGAFVGATSPTLVTPVLGVASATSINFGGTALSVYQEGSFSGTFTTNTVGDLSVSYASNTCYYTRIGAIVFVQYSMVFTPTYTTASGALRFAGLPYTVNNTSSIASVLNVESPFTFPAGATIIFGVATQNQTYITLQTEGSATAPANLTVANSGLTSGVQYTIGIAGFYYA